MEGSDFKVSALGHEVSKNEDGSYTVANVTGNLTITVEGVVKAEVSISLTKDGNGYSVTPAEGYSTTVNKGAEFKFKVEIKENFQAGSSFTVKANDTVLKETDGIYTIETVTSAQVITVFGVEMVPYEDTVSVNLTISEGTDRFYTSEITDEIMLYKEMEVPYFDLELYGLEKFYYNPYCYLDKDGNPVRQSAGNKETAYGVVTAMHAFIYATEVYYLGYEPDEACKGLSYNTEIEITNEYGETEIVNQYEISGEIMYQATLSGDYRANNKEGAKLVRIFKRLEKDETLAMDCIGELLKSKNVVVRSKGAAYCLALKRNIETGVRSLEEISRDPSYRLYQLNAEMTLKVWREKGELQLYPPKQQHN